MASLAHLVGRKKKPQLHIHSPLPARYIYIKLHARSYKKTLIRDLTVLISLYNIALLAIRFSSQRPFRNSVFLKNDEAIRFPGCSSRSGASSRYGTHLFLFFSTAYLTEGNQTEPLSPLDCNYPSCGGNLLKSTNEISWGYLVQLAGQLDINPCTNGTNLYDIIVAAGGGMCIKVPETDRPSPV